MIVHAYASQFPDDTASVIWGECPLPGTSVYDATKTSLQLWHFTFHNVPDLPESLIQGREKLYLKHFYDRLAVNPAAISEYDLGVYAEAFSAPGAMRAGLNLYRTFEQDAVHNTTLVADRGKSAVRCLALWGEQSFADRDAALDMAGTFYERVEFRAVAGCGHWIAEEKPGEFVDAVVEWIDG